MTDHKSIHSRVDQLEADLTSLKTDISNLRRDLDSFITEFKIYLSDHADRSTDSGAHYCTPHPMQKDLAALHNGYILGVNTPFWPSQEQNQIQFGGFGTGISGVNKQPSSFELETIEE